MADVAQLGYNTFQDIISNYSSTDAGAQFVLPKRVLDRMTPLVKMMPLKPSNNVLSNIATRTDSLPVNHRLATRASPSLSTFSGKWSRTTEAGASRSGSATAS